MAIKSGLKGKAIPVHKQLDALEKVQQTVDVKKAILLEKALKSSVPANIIKANQILQIDNKQDDERKSYIVDPYEFNQFLGYKNKSYSLSYQMLRKISYSVPIIRSIIGTRIDQISTFCEPQKDKYSTGFVIRKKKGYYSEQKDPSKQDLLKAEQMTEFILNCGSTDAYDTDDFDSFTRKVFNDSLSFDQLCFEVTNTRRGNPFAFYAVDGATMRIADTLDNKDYETTNQLDRKKVNGYYPSHCQIRDSIAVADFYPWEMCFGIRNPTTDIYANGYGISESEILTNIITSMLYSDEYNRRFFSQGSAPKGFFKLKSGTNLNNGRISEFKSMWQSMMAGVYNSHKTPMFEGDIEWVDLQHTNRDMEFSKWQEYLIKLTCAIFRIDPAEINFPLSGGSDQKMMFEGNNEARLKHSKDKGLYPQLRFYQRKLNKFLINRMDPTFELVFCGMDGMDVGTELDQDIKMLANFMTLDEMRVRRGLKPLGKDNGGSLVLNNIYFQDFNAKRQVELQKQQAQQQANPEVQGDGNEVEYQDEEDPFVKAFNSFIDGINKPEKIIV